MVLMEERDPSSDTNLQGFGFLSKHWHVDIYKAPHFSGNIVLIMMVLMKFQLYPQSILFFIMVIASQFPSDYLVAQHQ